MKISIAGQRHSQGGHTYYEDGIVVDMASYNAIVSIELADTQEILETAYLLKV